MECETRIRVILGYAFECTHLREDFSLCFLASIWVGALIRSVKRYQYEDALGSHILERGDSCVIVFGGVRLACARIGPTHNNTCVQSQHLIWPMYILVIQ